MKIALLGDIGLFGRHKCVDGRVPSFFDDVRSYLSTFDYVIGNLELPITNHARAGGAKSAYLKAAPEDLAILAHLGIDAVSLANNHILDYGSKGLVETIHHLNSLGIRHYGTCENPHLDISSDSQLLRLFGYCSFDTNPLGLISKVIPTFSVSNLRADLAASREIGAYPILSAHFGIEHKSYPEKRHVNALRLMTEEFDFVLHGHHPHMLQPMELRGRSLLAYSLGNFCFDNVIDPETENVFLEMQPLNRIGGILGVEIQNGAITAHDMATVTDEGSILLLRALESERMFTDICERFRSNEEECFDAGSRQRQSFLQTRINRRDTEFYMKRLRPRYAKLVATNFVNKLLDRRAVPF